MADKKISQLTALSAANLAPSTDVLAIVDTSATETKKIVAQDLINGVLNVASAVGIGTASPASGFKLDVVGGDFRVSDVASDDGVEIGWSAGGNSGFVQSYDRNASAFRNLVLNNAATIDSSGNLGLGVTPSLWNSDYKVLNIGSKGIVYGRVGSDETAIGANWYRTTAAVFAYASNGFATFYSQDSGNHSWYIAPNNTSGAGATASFTQAMRLTSGASNDRTNLLIGTTTPAYETASRGLIEVNGSSTALIAIKSGDTARGYFAAGSTATELAAVGASQPLLFTTNSGERGRFTAGGYFKASNDGTYIESTGAYHEFRSNITVANGVLFAHATSASATSDGIIQSRASTNTTNNTFYFLSCYNDASTSYKFRIADSGNATNTNGSYGTISDAKMKTDIVDAGSQWDDIKAVRFRKFKMKDDPSGLMQLGVVAQELEQTSPGLVDQHTDRDAEGNDLGTTTKSVKTSILLMKAAKALQEAMARIEQLEADMAALKASA